MPKQRRPRSPERNPLGLGANDRESSNTGSLEDTAYDAVASDPYLTGEPRKLFGPAADEGEGAPGDADDADLPDAPPRREGGG